MSEKPVIVVLELPKLVDIELELGPCKPASTLWRLLSIPKRTLYQWIEHRRVTTLKVMGQNFVPEREVLELMKGKHARK